MFAASDSVSFCLGILAGGAGCRLGGRDKGLMTVDGGPQVLRTATLIAGPSKILVSANRHTEAYRVLGFDIIKDAHDDFRGPLAGVAALLSACRTAWLLTVPVDVVRVPGDLFPRLLARISHHPPAADADSFAVTKAAASVEPDLVSAAPSHAFSSQRTPQQHPDAQRDEKYGLGGMGGNTVGIARVRDDDGLQPTLALYHTALALSATQALDQGERSLQRWQAAQGCAELRVAGVVGNRNQPTDYPPTSI